MPITRIDGSGLGNALTGVLTLGTADASPYGGRFNITNSGQASAFFWNLGIGSGHVGFTAASSNLKIYNTYNDGLMPNGLGIDIDIGGRIITPNQPAFWARGSADVSRSGAQTEVKLVCNVLISSSNRGSHYNTSTARFTAPVAGYYAFYISSATTTPTSSGPALILYRNGSGVVEVALNYSGSSYTQFGGMAVLSANAGDFFEPFIANYNSTSFTIDGSRTRFSGFFLG
jgi:hypothetical protein